jgi:hypothetical protein
MSYDFCDKRLISIGRSFKNSIMAFEDIFTKIESLKPNGAITEIWHQVNENRFECKVTGKKLDRIQFERYQNEKGGAFRFIIEIANRV